MNWIIEVDYFLNYTLIYFLNVVHSLMRDNIWSLQWQLHQPTCKNIQCHLLPTASVFNAAMFTIVSIDANNRNNIIWGVDQFLCSVGCHSKKCMGQKFLQSSTHVCIFHYPKVCRLKNIHIRGSRWKRCS